MPTLRKKLVRLAYTEPAFRKAVVGLLRVGELQFISNAARHAFDAELLPQIEPSATSPQQVEVLRAHLHGLLDAATKDKNNLYLLLIRYKSNDAGDAVYFDDLKKATDEWAARQTQTLLQPVTAPGMVQQMPMPVPVVQPQVVMPVPVAPVVPVTPAAPAAPAAPVSTTTTTTTTTVKNGRRSNNR